MAVKVLVLLTELKSIPAMVLLERTIAPFLRIYQSVIGSSQGYVKLCLKGLAAVF